MSDRAEDKDVRKIAEDCLPIVPLRNTVVFPGSIMPLTLGRPASVRAVEEAIQREVPLGLLAQRDPRSDPVGPEGLYQIGTAAEVQKLVTPEGGQRLVLVRGRQRFRAVEFVQTSPFLIARIELLEETVPRTTEFEARILNLRRKVRQALSLLPQEFPELAAAIEAADNPGLLIDLVASTLGISTAEKQDLLEAVNLEERVRKITQTLDRQIEILSITKKIGTEAKQSIDKSQREYFLREQLKAIQKELGDGEPRASEIAGLRARVDKAGMPSEVEREARSELNRLERIPEASAEYSVVRTHLDWLLEMPWNKSSQESLNMAAARGVLEADHCGLEKVKKRILEFLAVRKLKPGAKGPILCFVGPPGVGKTSLGRSIARATNRAFIRQSLGGVHDEAEMRGHRRTYVGALPGRIIQGIRKAGTKNPVFVLDEVDKLSASLQGDPAAALLEVLDPEQNSTFEDHYLGVPFDLSGVLFIATANVLEDIPPPLRDRMEVIEVSGYTEEEKLAIAERHLLVRQVEANGLQPSQVVFKAEALREIIRGYTLEAGVRQLEREIGAVCRAVAARFAEGKTEPAVVNAASVRSYLGIRRFLDEVALRTSLAGVATGLAWTPMGGDILFVEATRVPGNGKLLLTGKLGEVMKESAQAALSLIKGRARELRIPPRLFQKTDLHVHLPSGAIPKDGPSAGITIFVALASLLSGRKVQREVAMTGEISLRGLVLPVGGIKEKVLAAKRAGIRRVLLPRLNEKDLEELAPQARRGLEFTFLERVDDAIRHALESRPAPAGRKPGASRKPRGRRQGSRARGVRTGRLPSRDAPSGTLAEIGY